MSTVKIEDIVACVSFPDGSREKRNLVGIITSRYKLKKQNGASEEEAVNAAADALSEALDILAKK